MKNFKIGDSIHHMELNKPVVSEVKAIISIEGELELGYKKFKSETGIKKTIYSVGYATYLDEENCFKDIESLKNSLFS